MRKCVLALARISCAVEYSMICYNKPIRFASAVTGTDYGFLATFDCTYQKYPGDEGIQENSQQGEERCYKLRIYRLNLVTRKS